MSAYFCNFRIACIWTYFSKTCKCCAWVTNGSSTTHDSSSNTSDTYKRFSLSSRSSCSRITTKLFKHQSIATIASNFSRIICYNSFNFCKTPRLVSFLIYFRCTFKLSIFCRTRFIPPLVLLFNQLSWYQHFESTSSTYPSLAAV